MIIAYWVLALDHFMAASWIQVTIVASTVLATMGMLWILERIFTRHRRG